jgi:hypothetical protein
MIIFRNPGLIDLLAVTTMGISIKLPDAFGRFGTGIKYGVASVLRGGGAVTIYRGKERHDFSLERATVGEGERAREFDFVCLDGIRIGFTTQLGRDWKPWMVLREFGCNAMDEKGEFYAVDEPATIDLALLTDDESTVVIIDWADLDTAYKQRADLFLEGEALFANDAIRILPGPSAHIFYRGIRVFKTEKPCLFTYDLLAEQPLTEDRTLAGSWGADRLIRDTLLSMGDAELIRQAITSGDQYHEAVLNFADAGFGVAASPEFVKAATIVRESGDRDKLSASARTVVAQAARQAIAEERVTRRQVPNDSFQQAIASLLELGVEFADDQSFIEVGELPGDARSTLEGGTIFLLRSLMLAEADVIADQLMRRWVDLQPRSYAVDSVLDLLIPKLLNAAPELREERERRERREAQARERAELAAAAAAEAEAPAEAEVVPPPTPVPADIDDDQPL